MERDTGLEPATSSLGNALGLPKCGCNLFTNSILHLSYYCKRFVQYYMILPHFV